MIHREWVFENDREGRRKQKRAQDRKRALQKKNEKKRKAKEVQVCDAVVTERSDREEGSSDRSKRVRHM